MTAHPLPPYRQLWGTKVAEARRAAGLTQAELASATDIAQQTISAIETGDRAASDANKAILAITLGTQHELLFPMDAVYRDLALLASGGER